MKKINAAIFGTGFMGRVHAEATRRLGNVEIAAIAGSTPERARAFANGIGVDRSSGNYPEVLADPGIEVVHICTPNHLHFAMATDALKAGKHVICEKPLATSIEDGEEMVALATRAGLRNCTFHNVSQHSLLSTGSEYAAHHPSGRDRCNLGRARHIFAGLVAL